MKKILTQRQINNRIVAENIQIMYDEHYEGEVEDSIDPFDMDEEVYLNTYKERFPKCTVPNRTIISIWYRELAKIDSDLMEDLATGFGAHEYDEEWYLHGN